MRLLSRVQHVMEVVVGIMIGHASSVTVPVG